MDYLKILLQIHHPKSMIQPISFFRMGQYSTSMMMTIWFPRLVALRLEKTKNARIIFKDYPFIFQNKDDDDAVLMGFLLNFSLKKISMGQSIC